MSSLQQEVYETIRGRLLSGQWRPGQKLGEQKLAAELGVNRNPVREALLKLTGEGLLERHAGLGCRVARMDIDILRGLWQLRESLEGMGARLAAERIAPVQLMRLEHEHALMQQLTHEGQEQALVDSDNRFHHMILEFSGNRILLEVWHNYLQRIIVAQTVLFPAYRHLDAVHRETFSGHAEIVKALATRKPDQAEQVMRRAIRDGFACLMKALKDLEANSKERVFRR